MGGSGGEEGREHDAGVDMRSQNDEIFFLKMREIERDRKATQ
jgi:hypothetical protein